MKEKLTNNLALKLLSLALAAFLWILAVVVNLDDPVTSVQFSNVPVEILAFGSCDKQRKNLPDRG